MVEALSVARTSLGGSRNWKKRSKNIPISETLFSLFLHNVLQWWKFRRVLSSPSVSQTVPRPRPPFQLLRLTSNLSPPRAHFNIVGGTAWPGQAMRQALTRRVTRAPYDPGTDTVMVVRVLCVYRSEGHTALQLHEFGIFTWTEQWQMRTLRWVQEF